MSLVPGFQVELWNAWLLVLSSLLVAHGLSYLLVDRKAALFASSDYSDAEKKGMAVLTVLLLLLVPISIFLPLRPGTMWIYVGLTAYLLGMLRLLLATYGFACTATDEPVTTGIFRFSRNPMYLGFAFVFLGTELATVS